MSKYIPTLIVLIAIGLLYTKLSKIEAQLFTLMPAEEVGRLNNHTYMYVPKALRWDDAKKYAELLGGHLVTFQSEEENKFVYNLARKGGSDTSVWIGLTDAGHEGRWTWVTGEALDYVNWERKPNGGKGQNYADIGFGKTERWNDAENDGLHPFVVEYEHPDKRRSSEGAETPKP
ncbi:hypothetical protein BH09VER1_BH09VER1_30540 [soil metagenome]